MNLTQAIIIAAVIFGGLISLAVLLSESLYRKRLDEIEKMVNDLKKRDPGTVHMTMYGGGGGGGIGQPGQDGASISGGTGGKGGASGGVHFK